MKKTTADTTLEVWTDCPHCNEYLEVTEQLRECLGEDLRATDIEEEITCDNKKCGKTFLITEINY